MATSFSLSSLTISSGSKVPPAMSTPIVFLGRSLIWPIEASTSKSLPRYLLIVLALAGDSTITRDLLILPSLQIQSLAAPLLKEDAGTVPALCKDTWVCHLETITPRAFLPSQHCFLVSALQHLTRENRHRGIASVRSRTESEP